MVLPRVPAFSLRGAPAAPAFECDLMRAHLTSAPQEFHPYVFQILAQLIELSTPPLKQARPRRRLRLE